MSNRSRLNWLIPISGISILSITSGLFLWWNTNLLGDDEFCDGAVTSAELSSVLDTEGRLTSISSAGSGVPDFTCNVQRTSKFLGAAPMEIELNTGVHEPDFQFQTHVWKNPSGMSFFSNGATGAVSDVRGWVLLPEACWEKVGSLNLGGRRMPNTAEVTTVEAVLKRGTVDRTELAKTLVKSAQRIAAEAGCGTAESDEEPRLQDASELAPTVPAAACGLAGFTLPPAALLKDEATIGKEQVSGSIPGTWACGMHLAGNAEAVIWFAASSDPRIVDPILKKDSFKDLPGGTGVIERQKNATVLKCGSQQVYFSMRWNGEYQSAVSDRGISVSHEMFQSFVDSAGKQYQCGAVQLPPN